MNDLIDSARAYMRGLESTQNDLAYFVRHYSKALGRRFPGEVRDTTEEIYYRSLLALWEHREDEEFYQYDWEKRGKVDDAVVPVLEAIGGFDIERAREVLGTSINLRIYDSGGEIDVLLENIKIMQGILGPAAELPSLYDLTTRGRLTETVRKTKEDVEKILQECLQKSSLSTKEKDRYLAYLDTETYKLFAIGFALPLITAPTAVGHVDEIIVQYKERLGID